MSLDHQDLELIEKLIYKNSDDIAVSISRSFERLEERIDAVESRLYSRFGNFEDKIDSGREEVADAIHELKLAIRDFTRMKDDADLENESF